MISSTVLPSSSKYAYAFFQYYEDCFSLRIVFVCVFYSHHHVYLQDAEEAVHALQEKYEEAGKEKKKIDSLQQQLKEANEQQEALSQAVAEKEGLIEDRNKAVAHLELSVLSLEKERDKLEEKCAEEAQRNLQLAKLEEERKGKISGSKETRRDALLAEKQQLLQRIREAEEDASAAQLALSAAEQLIEELRSCATTEKELEVNRETVKSEEMEMWRSKCASLEETVVLLQTELKREATTAPSTATHGRERAKISPRRRGRGRSSPPSSRRKGKRSVCN